MSAVQLSRVRPNMKRLPPFLILVLTFLLGGCTTQLNVAKDSGRFADTLGIPVNGIQFLGYCYFGKSHKGPEQKFIHNEGVAVATTASLYLVREEGQENTGPKYLSLKYSDFQTVTHVTQGYGSQIHIESADEIILLEIIRGALYDPGSSRTLIDLISSKGVRVVEIHNNFDEWFGFEGTGGMSPIGIFMGL